MHHLKNVEQINENFVDDARHINIAVPMYNLTAYSDNYSDTCGSLWQFKRDEIEGDADLTVDAQHIPNNSSSFKYKSSFITGNNDVKIAVPLKYLSNFWRSFEMSLINREVELSLKWYEDCILPSTGTAATFAITDTKLYVPVVNLKIEDNAKLSNLLSDGFKRSVYWYKYQTILKDHAQNENIRVRLDASFQDVNKLFVLAYTRGNNVTKENDIMKIVQAVEDSDILLEGVTKRNKNETKEKKGWFLSILLGTFGASLSRNLLTGKGIVRAGSGNKKGKGIVRAGSRKQILRAGFGKQLDFDGTSSFNKF